MTSLVYARISRGGRWHIARNDGHTVCGKKLVEFQLENDRRPRHVCKSCDGMKNADTVKRGLLRGGR